MTFRRAGMSALASVFAVVCTLVAAAPVSAMGSLAHDSSPIRLEVWSATGPDAGLRPFIEGAPNVTTGGATLLTKATATVEGTVTPGETTLEACEFEYGTTTSYGASAPCTTLPEPSETPVAVSANLESLEPGTTYHYRLAATGGGLTGDGGDQTFTTLPPTPSVSGIAPAEGPADGGTLVTVTGTDLAGASTVSFGGIEVTPSSCTATECEATSPAGSGTVHVTVTTAGGTSSANSADKFTYVPTPIVTGVSPVQGPAAGGTVVTIKGAGLGHASEVSFGGTEVTPSSCSATQCKATSPAGSGTVHVTVTTVGGTSATSSADKFTYVPLPVVSGIAPAEGPDAGGTVVTVTGTDLAGASTVSFGGTGVTPSSCSATECEATSPAGSGTAHVTVTTAGGTSTTSSADEFTYVPAPSVSSVAPTEGPAAGGTLVRVKGTGLEGASEVSFGAASVTPSSCSATECEATSPAGSGTVDITVTTVGGISATSSADEFTYVPAPSVSSVSPGGGPLAGGTPVKVEGSDLSGATRVSFGPSGVTPSSCSATECKATSPAGSGTVDVTVTTVGGTSSMSAADEFTYVSGVTVLTHSLIEGRAARGYSQALEAAGGIAPYGWSVSGGVLPAGLRLNGQTGAIVGTPRAIGTSSFTVRVTDSASPRQSASAGLSIKVAAAASTLAQYGQCLPEKKGNYIDANCTAFAEKKGKPVEHKGKFEFDAGPAPRCVLQKRGEYIDPGCTVKAARTGGGHYEKRGGPFINATAGSTTLEVPGLAGQVVCSSATAAGEVKSTQMGLERITFSGCEASGRHCTSEGPNSTPSGKAGVIATNKLETQLVGPVGGHDLIEFLSAEHEPYVAEFGCEAPRLFRLIGSLSGVQEGNVGVPTTTSTTTFAGGLGEQALYTELSEDAGASWLGPEASIATMVLSNTTTSTVEIKP